ncbi:MAG: ribokinase [Caulobacterales bacterium]
MIVVLGSINVDQTAVVKRLPRAGETLAGGVLRMAPGGKGANQALAARRAGGEVRLVGAVGQDAFAAQALALLAAEGVDLAGVRTVAGATGLGLILVDSSGENMIVVVPGANAQIAEADADLALEGLGEGDVLLLQQEIPAAATGRALELARRRGVTSVLNVAPVLEFTPRLARAASIVIANESEFAMLSGGDPQPLPRSMQEMARANDQTVIVTLGPGGALAATGLEMFDAPALAIEPVDTVGAGDTFCGYLAAGLEAGLDLESAMRRATAAASLACLAPGAQPAIPRRDQLAPFALRERPA